MSLRRRIAAAAAVAVAAVAVAVALTSYLTTRAHLIDQVKDALTDQASFYLAPHVQGGGGGGPHRQGGGRRGGELGEFRLPPQPLGGAEGVIQFVGPTGKILNNNGTKLPVTPQVLRIARDRAGSVFYTTRVGSGRTHFQIYAAWDAPDQHVVMVGLSLADTDEVLHNLLLPYGLLIAGGVLLATVLGLAISRSAGRRASRKPTRSSSAGSP